VSSRITNPGPHQIEQGRDVGPGRVPRPLDVGCGLLFHFLVPSVDLGLGGNARLHQPLAAADHRAARDPAFDLFARAIVALELVIEERADVLAPAIGHALQEIGAFAGAQLLEDRLRRLEHFEYIVAVDPLGRDLE